MDTRSTHKEHEALMAENAKLKAENAKLTKVASRPARQNKAKQPGEIARKISVVMLVAFAVALLTTGNLLFWFGNTIVKTDRFVAATSPIIKDPEVQQSMALYTTNSIFNSVDVEKLTEEALPPRAEFLAPQLTSQLKSATQSSLNKALQKPAFQERWNTILAAQHDRLVSFAAKYQGDGSISLNDVYNQLSGSLKSTKLAFLADKILPSKIGNITVVNATWLPAFHNVVVNIDTWRLLTIFALILTIALAVWLSRNKRKTLYLFSLTSAFFMLLLLVSVRFAREQAAQKVDPQYADGVRSALQIFTHSFVIQTTTIVFALLLLGFIVWVSGRSKSAVAVKNKTSLLFSGKAHTQLFGSGANKYADWVGQNKRVLQWCVVGVLTVTMLLVRLTFKTLLIYAFLMLLFILAIEVIGGQPRNKITGKA
jgi:hypothetical protein